MVQEPVNDVSRDCARALRFIHMLVAAQRRVLTTARRVGRHEVAQCNQLSSSFFPALSPEGWDARGCRSHPLRLCFWHTLWPLCLNRTQWCRRHRGRTLRRPQEASKVRNDFNLIRPVNLRSLFRWPRRGLAVTECCRRRRPEGPSGALGKSWPRPGSA